MGYHSLAFLVSRPKVLFFMYIFHCVNLQTQSCINSAGKTLPNIDYYNGFLLIKGCLHPVIMWVVILAHDDNVPVLQPKLFIAIWWPVSLCYLNVVLAHYCYHISEICTVADKNCKACDPDNKGSCKTCKDKYVSLKGICISEFLDAMISSESFALLTLCASIDTYISVSNTRISLLKISSCRLFSAMHLTEPMLVNC